MKYAELRGSTTNNHGQAFAGKSQVPKFLSLRIAEVCWRVYSCLQHGGLSWAYVLHRGVVAQTDKILMPRP